MHKPQSFSKKMKNVTMCYGQNAIKVSDSYCSGHSNKPCSNVPHESIQNAVKNIYKFKLSTGITILIRLTWCNRLFSVTIFDPHDHSIPPVKFSKSLRVPCGGKSLMFTGLNVEVLWDLSRAKYDSGPEPTAGFYFKILVDSELMLMLGDIEQESEEPVKKSAVSLILRSEYFSGNAVYLTQAKFCDSGIFHDISINLGGGDDLNPVLLVLVDQKSVVEVKRLKWNFRGNETIFLDGLLVDFMWDVRGWLFSSTEKEHAVFLFRTRRKGLMDNRLWLEEDKKNGIDDHEGGCFSFLICACKKPE